MKIDRKKATIAAISVSVMLIFISALKLYLTISFSENDLRNIVVSFCKNNLGKSAKLESIRISCAGNIIVTNFNLSTNSDFNDSISLVKAEETVFNLSFFRLILGVAEVNSIVFRHAEISIHKSYGKSYYETIKNIIELPANFSDLKNINMENLTLRFHDSTVFYHEYFTEERLDMECRNFSAAFRKRGDRIKYSLSGDMRQYKTKKIKEGEISAKGVIQLGQNGESRHSVEIENLDLSLFNNHIGEYLRKDLFFTGGFSASVKIDRENGAYTCRGELSTDNINVTSTGADQFEIIANGNFNTEFNMKYSGAEGLIEIGKLRLHDDNMDVLLSGKKIGTAKDKILALRIGTEKIDLDELSAYIKPVKDCAYRGETSLFADIYLDFNNDANNYIAVEGTSRDLGISLSRSGTWKDLISGCSGQVSIKNRQAHASATLKASASDFTFDLQSAFETYMPLKSASRIVISSNRTQMQLAFEVINRAISFIFDSAYEDEKLGYDDIFFLKKPESAIINGNDLTLECHVDSLAFNEKAGLRNLNLKSSLTKGVLSVDSFSMEGFDGIYSLQAQCFFNRDYPAISIKGGVRNFDLGMLSSEMKAPYTFSGRMNIDFDYELTAYRMLQVLQNSRGNLNISLSNAVVSETPGQRSFAAYLEKSGSIRAPLANLNITSLSMGLTQGADSFMIRNFACTGDPLSWSGYGTYNYQKGLNMPVSAIIKDREGKIQSAQFVITGRLIDPLIQLKTKKAGNFSLFSDGHL